MELYVIFILKLKRIKISYLGVKKKTDKKILIILIHCLFEKAAWYDKPAPLSH